MHSFELKIPQIFKKTFSQKFKFDKKSEVWNCFWRLRLQLKTSAKNAVSLTHFNSKHVRYKRWKTIELHDVIKK